MDTRLDTFPRLLLHHAQVRAAHPAVREKDLGIWQAWTWRQVADEVRALACGLAAQGFTRGMHLAIIGDNRPRLYWSMAAAQALGGIPVPMYQDAPLPTSPTSSTTPRLFRRLPKTRVSLTSSTTPGPDYRRS